MARTLTQELRDKVIAAIDGGMTGSEAARRFGVSQTTASRWRKEAQERTPPVAKRRGGDNRSIRIEAHGEFIKGLVAEQPDVTLAEVRDKLVKRGLVVATSTVFRFFVRHGIPPRQERKRDLPAPYWRRRDGPVNYHYKPQREYPAEHNKAGRKRASKGSD